MMSIIDSFVSTLKDAICYALRVNTNHTRKKKNQPTKNTVYLHYHSFLSLAWQIFSPCLVHVCWVKWGLICYLLDALFPFFRSLSLAVIVVVVDTIIVCCCRDDRVEDVVDLPLKSCVISFNSLFVTLWYVVWDFDASIRMPRFMATHFKLKKTENTRKSTWKTNDIFRSIFQMLNIFLKCCIYNSYTIPDPAFHRLKTIQLLK